MRERLKDGEHRALRVGDYGPAAHAFHGGWPIVDISPEGFGLGGRAIAIGCQKIEQPVRRDAGLRAYGRYASNERFAVLDVQVSGRIVLAGRDLPAKQIGVELSVVGAIGGFLSRPPHRLTPTGATRNS